MHNDDGYEVRILDFKKALFTLISDSPPGSSLMFSNIVIAPDVHAQLREYLATIKPQSVCIISDDNLKQHLDRLTKQIAEFNPLSIVLPSGELTKCRPIKTIVEDLLLSSQFTRSSSVIIGLGGGVIGDLSGTI